MSTLEKAIELLHGMSENKLEAVYMYMCFVDSQADSNEGIHTPSGSIDSLIGIAHEYANPTLIEKETEAFENTVSEKYASKTPLKKGNVVFKALCHLPERYQRILIIKEN